MTLPTPSSAMSASDGTRLESRWLAFDGGVRAFHSWFDRERGEECRFSNLVARGGTSHCLPVVYATKPGVFFDEACTELIALGDVGATVVLDEGDDACIAPFDVYELGSVLDRYFYKAPDGSCTVYAA